MKQTTRKFFKVLAIVIPIVTAITFGVCERIQAASVEKKSTEQYVSDSQHAAIISQIDTERSDRQQADSEVTATLGALSSKLDKATSSIDQIKGSVDTMLSMLKARVVETYP
jgi:flagellar motility protein MotE (MotC chaperone)